MVAFFYIFAGLLLLSSIGVISFRNPVYSVLCLIFAFTNVAGLFILIGAEFLAMSLVVVYVGAVAVLFLFVIMMLNCNLAELKTTADHVVPFGLIIGALFLLNLGLVVFTGVINTDDTNIVMQERTIDAATNVHMLGQVIYTDFIIQFQLAGLILFVAMVGAIVLAHKERHGTKKQNIGKQLNRSRKDCIRLVEGK